MFKNKAYIILFILIIIFSIATYWFAVRSKLKHRVRSKGTSVYSKQSDKKSHKVFTGSNNEKELNNSKPVLEKDLSQEEKFAIKQGRSTNRTFFKIPKAHLLQSPTGGVAHSITDTLDTINEIQKINQLNK